MEWPESATSERHEIVKKLVAWSDIVIDSFRPGVMKRLGLGYEDLRLIKPDIIMLSTTMQGQTGPMLFSRVLAISWSDVWFSLSYGWPDEKPFNRMELILTASLPTME